MELLDWILVVFGAAVAFTGRWIQLHPERVVPAVTRQNSELPVDPIALAQIRLLGGCFLFMGAFFVPQMAVDLTRLPWWTGTIGGVITSITAAKLVNNQVRRQQRRRRAVQQSSMPRKVLELRRF